MPDRVTHPYGVQDVEKLLRLDRGTIRAFVTAGFVSPARGARNSLRFSFQDLIVLRAAHALAEASVPPRRITRSMKELRRQLPESMPLSGLSISAVGDRVVVKEGTSRWQAESGQYLLAFEGPSSPPLLPRENEGPSSPPLLPREKGDSSPSPLGEGRGEGRSSPSPLGEGRGEGRSAAIDLFSLAASLEASDREAAIEAYEQAIAADPALLDARINLGRILHEAGRHAKAERVYREAMKTCGRDPTLLFNLGVLLDDMGRITGAIDAYESALLADPDMADCHYNLGLLYEKARRPRDALRHMARYRALARL